MIALKSFILRENKKKYNAGDNFPRELVSSDRVAELVSKGYLKGKDEAVVETMQEEAKEAEKPAKKSTEKKTSTRKRTTTKKG